MRLFAIAVFAAFAAVATPSFGQSETRTDTVYENITPADIQAIINGMGYANVVNASATRTDITTANGFRFSVHAAACDDGGRCYALEIIASWTLLPEDRDRIIAAANRFDTQYSLLKIATTDQIFAQRYVITDGGVTRRHLERELQEFESGVRFFVNNIREQTGAVLPSP